MAYFLIRTSEDGIRIEVVKPADLAKELRDGEYDVEEFCAVLPKASDPQYWGAKCVLIKGEIVVPKAVEVATEFDIP